MTLQLLAQEEVDALYVKLTIADALKELIFGKTDEGYDVLLEKILLIVGAIAVEKSTSPLYTDDKFKAELTFCMNRCLENKELTDKFGELWLAKDDNLARVINLVIKTVMERAMENYAAKYN